MRLHVLVLDDVFDLGLSAVLDAFQTANELIEVCDLAVPRLEVKAVGVRRKVRFSQGFSVPVQAAGAGAPDCVVVPAIGFKMPGPLEAALSRPDVQDAAALLRQWAGRGATMTAACIGTFVMAESGLLDRQRATTTWWLAPVFRRRYPGVLLDESNMIVRSGRFVTAGAALIANRPRTAHVKRGARELVDTNTSACRLLPEAGAGRGVALPEKGKLTDADGSIDLRTVSSNSVWLSAQSAPGGQPLGSKKLLEMWRAKRRHGTRMPESLWMSSSPFNLSRAKRYIFKVGPPFGEHLMLQRFFILLLLAAVLCEPAFGIEIATGKMLGSRYEPRAFYVREGNGPWRKTYSGDAFRPEAAGRMMNLRVAQALFHDEWLTEFPFDPARNTERLIEALDTYKDHGILAISVSLQGGNAGYNREFQGIKREMPAKPGPGNGALVSAFTPDGALKEPWMKRTLRLARELDRRGMILNLMYFYQRQDEVFSAPEAIDRAARNATDWLIDNNCPNVIIEIANEHDVNQYDHDRYIHHRMGHLIELARGRFQAKKAPFKLPISASTGGSMAVYDGVREHGDLVIIHGNNRTPTQKETRVKELVADSKMPGPIYMNEDDNGRETTPENLAKELESCDVVFARGSSWGYMPWRQLQMFPFRHYLPAQGTRVTAEMLAEERDPAYFHAVLDHIRITVYRPSVQPCRLSNKGTEK